MCEKGLFKKAAYNPLASFLAGVRFLTVIPIHWKREKDTLFFQSSLIWFPWIGLLIGMGSACIISLCGSFLPPSVSAVFAITLLAAVSGFLHIDGLADSGDGLLCSRPRKRALEIMRDSNTGAMGLTVVFLILLGKYAALSSLTVDSLLPAIILIPVAGRTAILLSMAILPYARSGDGLGQLFYSTESRILAIVGMLSCILITALVAPHYIVFVVAAILIPVGLFSYWCFKTLGGATGDTLGAICEITECAVAVSIVIALHPFSH